MVPLSHCSIPYMAGSDHICVLYYEQDCKCIHELTVYAFVCVYVHYMHANLDTVFGYLFQVCLYLACAFACISTYCIHGCYLCFEFHVFPFSGSAWSLSLSFCYVDRSEHTGWSHVASVSDLAPQSAWLAKSRQLALAGGKKESRSRLRGS